LGAVQLSDKMESVYELDVCGIAGIGPDGVLTFINAAGARLLGYIRADVSQVTRRATQSQTGPRANFIPTDDGLATIHVCDGRRIPLTNPHDMPPPHRWA